MKVVGKVLPLLSGDEVYEGYVFSAAANAALLKNTRLPVPVTVEYDSRQVVGEVVELVQRADGSVDAVCEVRRDRLGDLAGMALAPAIARPLDGQDGAVLVQASFVQHLAHGSSVGTAAAGTEEERCDGGVPSTSGNL